MNINEFLEQPIVILTVGAIAGTVFGMLLMALRVQQHKRRAALMQSQQYVKIGQLEDKLEEAKQVKAAADEKTEELQSEVQDKAEHIRRLELEEVRLQQISLQKQRLEDDYAQLLSEQNELRQSQNQHHARNAELQAKLQSERTAHNEKIQLLNEARDQLKGEFQNLANEIFAEKSKTFKDENKDALGNLLTPLREQLGDFKRRVEDTYDKESRDRRSLYEQIQQLKQLNQQMSNDAVNLTNALKGDSKTQGNWGEVILSRVLEQSGLREGHEYQTQVSLNDGSRRLQPDVIVRLPDDKDVIIDAKVSLTAYESFCSEDHEAVRERNLRDHLQSIRNHVRGLSSKSYQELEGVRTLDFVLLFIPIEGAFLLAVQEDQDLFSFAYERNIILVSPATLLVTLRTINNIWRYERQSRNAQEIARRGGELHDKFVGFVESLEDVGKHLERSSQAYQTAHKRLVSGRGNLVSQVASLQQLGVRNKKQMEKRLQDEATESELQNLPVENNLAADDGYAEQSLSSDTSLAQPSETQQISETDDAETALEAEAEMLLDKAEELRQQSQGTETAAEDLPKSLSLHELKPPKVRLVDAAYSDNAAQQAVYQDDSQELSEDDSR